MPAPLKTAIGYKFYEELQSHHFKLRNLAPLRKTRISSPPLMLKINNNKMLFSAKKNNINHHKSILGKYKEVNHTFDKHSIEREKKKTIIRQEIFYKRSGE